MIGYTKIDLREVFFFSFGLDNEDVVEEKLTIVSIEKMLEFLVEQRLPEFENGTDLGKYMGVFMSGKLASKLLLQI